MIHDLRAERRRDTDTLVELTWKSESGEKRFESCRAVNLSDIGVAVECPEPLPLLAHVIVRAHAFEVAALCQVKHCTWKRVMYVVGLHFVAKASTGAPDPMAPDHYEILRLGAGSDNDTIERVYRTLAKRFHPDNEKTGDAEIFLRIAEAHRILTDPNERMRYDTALNSGELVRFDLRSREFFAGLRGEQNRRMAVLCLLYRKRVIDLDRPGLFMLDLEQLSGFTREELGFALWYLKEKGLIKTGSDSGYSISAEGVDFVENRLTEEQPELRTIAALTVPDPAEPPRPFGQF
jgi:hypothetical protein